MQIFGFGSVFNASFSICVCYYLIGFCYFYRLACRNIFYYDFSYFLFCILCASDAD